MDKKEEYISFDSKQILIKSKNGKNLQHYINEQGDSVVTINSMDSKKLDLS